MVGFVKVHGPSCNGSISKLDTIPETRMQELAFLSAVGIWKVLLKSRRYQVKVSMAPNGLLFIYGGLIEENI